MIDLRSDTVTKPSPAMLEAMMSAHTGDDVFGEDPTVNELEDYGATLFGAEKALFCPSGTMTNQIGIHILSNPYEEVICYKGAHIYKYEGGGVAGTSGLSFRLLEGDRGRLSPEAIEENINPDDVHFPKSSVIALENTVNKGGGSYYTLAEIEKIAAVAKRHGLKLHLDGARLFNATIETGDPLSQYGAMVDTISVCLSKGLGAPVGSLLLGSTELIHKARRVRKFMGGGMRQAGYLAAAGLFALKNNIHRLKYDHVKAKKLGQSLTNCAIVRSVYPIDTNIVIFKLHTDYSPKQVLTYLEKKGVLAVPFGADEIRLVTHMDVNNGQIESACSLIEELKPEALPTIKP